MSIPGPEFHPIGLLEHSTAAALEEKSKLKKHFGRFDIFFFLICTIVGLDTLGQVASKGAQANHSLQQKLRQLDIIPKFLLGRHILAGW